MPIATLDYAPMPLLRRRRRFRRALFLVTAAIVIASGWRYGPAALHQLRFLYWQHRCLTFTAPPGTAVYRRLSAGSTFATPADYLDANSPEIPQSMNPIGMSQQRVGPPPEVEFCFVPRCWAGFLRVTENGSPFEPGEPVVFCHELRSPSGNRRLVVVAVYPDILSEMGTLLLDAFQAAVSDRAKELWVTGLDIMWEGPPIAGPSLIEAGQPDAIDRSHFTIAYQWPNGVRGTVDGWLQNDDTVKFSIRPGPGDIESEEERLWGRK
jgi:hypothetical protein